ncbi:4-hydroxy-tetrahydrodipicolinate synthase [Methanobrevibacter sp. 87.7]|uniref:4-hydroxy-tetrahydrodipicolinate synthase n=1 Tax=Methanobrevibacter sp. 87.7 TaxID=387957 RepID=UPI000B513EE0|nr:4-hydroxy-tetrahydrodipicolinate synthase [Methanobrevibacter sp. 87.7]OWT33080.1 4-hydroxy-tetrahydrodipicolinate synthase [Methanobrevibacter sp. 87.7]
MSFEGTAVAMLTPFTSDNKIDEEGFRENIDFLIEKGVDGLLVAGTTGESATLTHEEHRELVEILIDQANGKVATIAGAGSNSTDEALGLTKFSEDAGADYVLVITPYYNKPQQHGLVEHYKYINDHSDIPIIAYNVPSRTGIDMASETICELAKLDNVTDLKEANPSLDKTNKTFSLLKENDLQDDITILSGNDGLTLPLMSIGAKGVVSASANVDPVRMVKMVDSILDGDFDTAKDLHYQMLPLIDALFIETSPAPVKAAYKMMNRPAGPLRLPLAPIKEDSRKVLENVLKNDGFI